MPPVRESRHLWVGNIPDSITEEKLVEYFQRYGRIDSVKILAKRSVDGGQAAFVDFVDIRCAIKAHESPNRLGDRELRTDYNEPASTTLARSHGEQPRRYERGGRGPGDEGYSSRQNEGYQGNYPYKDEAPARRDYERVESSERNTSRITEESPVQYQQSHHSVVKAKDSDSGQSGSGTGTAVSGSGSDSSDSEDSDNESDSDSSVSETSKAVKKTKALQIRNLSSRSTDATIREGLYHEFKKHGDVGHIKVLGRDNNRHAIVCFRRHEDVIKAMDTCRGKMFLGLEMELTPCEDDEYEGSFHHYRRHSEGAGTSSFGNADDVYMFNATRTIFVGNIERNATSSELKRMFERYGEIVDVDIKKQGSNGAYAFIQYLDITHAVEARKQMNRALSGRNRLKIGFGKGMPTSTIWIGGLVPTVTEQMIERHFQRFGRVNRVGLDQERSYAMVTFDNLDGSTMAHNDVKNRAIFGKRVRVDYASRESQHFFYDHLANTGQGDGRRYEPSPPQSYRPRSGNKSYEEPTVRSRTAPIKQDTRGSKYQSYEHGYERGPGLNEGGRRHYDEYYRGPPPAGGYESDDFGQELREYNVTRERERAREREQDRRQEPPRRRHHRETTGRHEGNTESDGERYYSRGEHSDVWQGDSGKDRGSRESSVEPRDDSHRRGDKRRDGDKRRGEEKRGHAKGRYEGQSEEDLEPIEKQPPEKKEQREKNFRKKPIEPREDYGKPEFYPTSYEKGYDGKEKDVISLKRDVKQERDIQGGTSAEEGGKVSMEEGKGDSVVKEEKVRNRKEERSAEKAIKKMKNKEGKKKRKNKKSPVEMPPASVPSTQVDSDDGIEATPRLSRDNIPQSHVEIPESRVEIPQSRVEIPRSRVEIPRSRVEIPQSRVEIPQSRVETPHPRVEIPQSRVEISHPRVEISQSRVDIPQSRVEMPHSRVEIPHSRVEIPHSRVEKREEPIKDHKKPRKSGASLKSAVVVKTTSENSEKDRRQYRDSRRPKSPSPQEQPEEHISRKRPRSPERDAEHHHAKNVKHVDSARHSNGDHDDLKRKKRRQSNEATPPPPPPPPPPHHHSSRSTQQSDPRKFAKERNKEVSSSSRDSSSHAPPNNVGQSASARSTRDTSTFKPHVSDAVPGVSSAEPTKHVTSTQAKIIASPTDSPVPAQTGSGPLPNSDDTLMELLRRHPVMWQGLLGLKNDSAAIQMHYVSGNSKLAEYSLPKPSGGTGTNGLAIPPVLRIAQRMRMEASQLEGVTKRMQLEKEHCLLLALPCGRDPLDVHAQTRALKNGFIAYLQQKLAAGIINIAQPGSQQASFVLHVFPPCEFTHSHLSRVAPNLLDSATDSGHLMVVVATV